MRPSRDEPYWATACFSSAICSALIEKFGFFERSKPITRASNFWPTWKRSGRCSSRSRPRSVRLMKPVAPSSPTWTSSPPSCTSSTVTVTVSFLLTPPDAAGHRRRAALGDPPRSSCFMPSEMRSFSTSDVEHDRLHHLALVVQVERFLAGHAPGDVRHVDHAVHVAVQADEQAELGGVLDLALDLGADRMLVGESVPRIGLRLLEAQRDAALLLVDLE